MVIRQWPSDMDQDVREPLSRSGNPPGKFLRDELSLNEEVGCDMNRLRSTRHAGFECFFERGARVIQKACTDRWRITTPFHRFSDRKEILLCAT